MEYKHRVIDELLKNKLRGIGAVLIEGPKLCGKTTSAEQAAKSILYMAKPGEFEQNIAIANMQPSILLEGDTPRLIDEWQAAPKLWDAVRFEVDHRGKVGQFILTGSAIPANRDSIFHSGTGRVAWLTMRTMSLFESGDSDGSISLKSLFSDENYAPAAKNPINDIKRIAFLACRGGWPTTLSLEEENALEHAYDYVKAVVDIDISRVDGVRRDSKRAKRLMRVYARYQGSQATNEAIRQDVRANDSDNLDVDTVVSYMNALRKIFVIEDMAAWNPNIRSKTAIRTSDTRYFTDPSIATASLGLGPGDLVNDLNTFGFIFEAMCIRDLRIYADALNGQVYHYRDKSGLECDAVIHLRDGRYGLIEIKLGGEENIEHGAKTLKALLDKLDIKKMNPPSFAMVLVGSGSYAYKREDGIFVVPIGCLRD